MDRGHRLEIRYEVVGVTWRGIRFRESGGQELRGAAPARSISVAQAPADSPITNSTELTFLFHFGGQNSSLKLVLRRI